MQFIANLPARVWAVLGLVAVVVLLYLGYQHYKAEVVELKADVKSQNTTIAVQRDTLVTDAKLDKVDEAAQVQVQQAIKEALENHAAIQTKVDTKARQIEQTYADQPVTIKTVEDKQDALSAARIDSLWEAYCATVPTSTQCKP